MEKLFEKEKVCAIFRGIPDDRYILYAKALYKGGIRLFEVSMTDSGAANQILGLRRELPEDASIGAGTVVNRLSLSRAEKAGAEFYLSPSADTEILKLCQEKGRKLIPGVFTPSDISRSLRFGFHVLKLFPACEVSERYLRQLKGPFPGVKFIAVGGITLTEVPQKLKEGYIGVGIGNGIVPKEWVEDKEWDRISGKIKEVLFSDK